MKEDEEELIQFVNLKKAKEFIINQLHGNYYIVDEKPHHHYKDILIQLGIDYSLTVENKFKINVIVTEEDGDIVRVMFVGKGVHDTYKFNSRNWLRERKLKTLIV